MEEIFLNIMLVGESSEERKNFLKFIDHNYSSLDLATIGITFTKKK